ncbi:MAG TPA: nucleotidyltransferase domain-containing protein [Solirubrobacteraceae bacterium]|jgi:predicted nucleotidyltransferase|nr:nucleotidyltransferase domain-containing protein [Solirubrobacteraceae bacterium]
MLDERHEYSRSRLNKLIDRLGELDRLLVNHRLCVYATGSYGRLEAWEGSDIDLFFLYDDTERERLPWTTFIRLAAHLIEVTQDMSFPPFSGDGRYLEIQYVAKMERVLGSLDDDSMNSFTARMLLLLESQALYRKDVYDALLERIVGFYYRDYPDHEQVFVPTFLVNDILRYWRTLTLNYEHHRMKLLTNKALTDRERAVEKAGSALKNYKLKVSRLATCFSMVAHLSSADPPVTPEAVLDLCKKTPQARFVELRGISNDGDQLIDEMASLYGEFLAAVQRTEPELFDEFANPKVRKDALAHAQLYGDLIYRLLGEIVEPERMRSLVV